MGREDTTKEEGNPERNKHGFTKEEIKENQKDIVKSLVKPTIKYWKEQPIKSISQFLIWVIIVYAIMILLQAVNYDMIYCNSTLEEYNGKVMDTYNPFVKEMNQRIDKFNKQYTPMQLEGMTLPQELNQTIKCNYNLKKWWKDDSQIGQNMKKMTIQRWA